MIRIRNAVFEDRFRIQKKSNQGFQDHSGPSPLFAFLDLSLELQSYNVKNYSDDYPPNVFHASIMQKIIITSLIIATQRRGLHNTRFNCPPLLRDRDNFYELDSVNFPIQLVKSGGSPAPPHSQQPDTAMR